MKPNLVASVAAAVGFLAGGSSIAAAQGWSAQLVLSPLPSPFLSDWEVDPTIGEFVVTNSTSAAADVTFHYTLTRNGQQLLRGTTDPQRIPTGAPIVFNAASTFGGRADWDRSVQDLVARTGRFPEGEYEGCVTVAGGGGVVLVPRQCVRFSSQYPDPPFLVFPMNGDTIRTQDPFFQWQPVQSSVLGDARIGYVLQIAEVRASQLPEVALQSNILHYVEPNLVQTSQQYPVGALPLVSGRTYAWRVQALDGDGRPAASNQGRSEVWTFVYREPESEVRRAVASVELTPRRDTLRFAGDTARFAARAFDADNVEILDKRLQWRSTDTTVARVDASGIVTAVGGGETMVVASADGVADSAAAVMAASNTLAVRFESFDPNANDPSLLELIKSGSFEEVAPKLSALLGSGEFRIPIPVLAALRRAAGGGSGGASASESTGDVRRSGPQVGPEEHLSRIAECSQSWMGVSRTSADETKKVWAIEISGTDWTTIADNCIGQPGPADSADSAAPASDTTLHVSALFAVSWEHPGVPRAFLAVKGMGMMPWQLAGTEAHVRYVVVNLTRAMTVESKMLPTDFNGFFGTESFDAGFGVTFYAKRRCVDLTTQLCRIINWFNAQDPSITVEAFAGLNAAEKSVGTGGFGQSQAWGVTLKAKTPKRRIDIDPAGIHVDMQLGLVAAVQDSIVWQDTTRKGNWSASLSPMLGLSWQDASGRDWEVEFAAGLEIDPTDPSTLVHPKLVASGTLDATAKVMWFRVGKPNVVLTKVLKEDGTGEVAISGAWGVGPWDLSLAEFLGLSDGSGGFEQVGRGSLTFTWTHRNTRNEVLTQAFANQDVAKVARDSATAQVRRLINELYETRKKAAEAKDNLAQNPNDPQLKLVNDSYALRVSVIEETLQRKREERASLQKIVEGGPQPELQKCWKVSSNGMCVNWALRGSVGTGAIADIVALIVRTGITAVSQ